MGGVMILFSIGVSTLLWANLANPYIWVCLFVLFGYGAIGLWMISVKLPVKILMD